MRKPDPEYIVNIINNILGKKWLVQFAVAELSDTYVNVRSRLYPAAGYVIKEWLQHKNVETLARIIEYSDLNVQVGEPPLIRRQCIQLVANNLYMDRTTSRTLSPSGLFSEFCGSGGRQLLERAALVTLLMIIVDMVQQENYREDEFAVPDEEQEYWEQTNGGHTGLDSPPE